MPTPHDPDHDDSERIDVAALLGREPGLDAGLAELLGLAPAGSGPVEPLPAAVIIREGSGWELRPDWWPVSDPVELATVQVAGGALTVPIPDPWAPLHVRVTDPEAATWVAELLGEEAAEVIAGQAGEIAEELLEPTELRLAAARLALGQWLRQWWPRAEPLAPAADRLLELELGVLARTCAPLLPERDRAVLAVLVDDALQAVAGLSRLPEAYAPRARVVLARALRGALETMSGEHPLAEEAVATADLLERGEPVPPRSQGYALAAGDRDRPEFRGTADGITAGLLLADRWQQQPEVAAACPPEVDDPELPFLAEMTFVR